MVNKFDDVIRDVAHALSIDVVQVTAVLDLYRLYKRRFNSKKEGI